MKKSYQLALILLTAASATLPIGCGKGDNNPPVPTTPGNATACAAGSVYSTQYGCLPQGGCPSGQGVYNNQCVAVNGSVGAGYPGGSYPGYPNTGNPNPGYPNTGNPNTGYPNTGYPNT